MTMWHVVLNISSTIFNDGRSWPIRRFKAILSMTKSSNENCDLVRWPASKSENWSTGVYFWISRWKLIKFMQKISTRHAMLRQGSYKIIGITWWRFAQSSVGAHARALDTCRDRNWPSVASVCDNDGMVIEWWSLRATIVNQRTLAIHVIVSLYDCRFTPAVQPADPARCTTQYFVFRSAVAEQYLWDSMGLWQFASVSNFCFSSEIISHTRNAWFGGDIARAGTN